MFLKKLANTAIIVTTLAGSNLIQANTIGNTGSGLLAPQKANDLSSSIMLAKGGGRGGGGHGGGGRGGHGGHGGGHGHSGGADSGGHGKQGGHNGHEGKGRKDGDHKGRKGKGRRPGGLPSASEGY
ncbi:hypothetical protein [Endozoicomonas sp. Mp262]|uniref:hypothetical protein n=1 Tax=Endozoicomonas sp. Mp262 TaxID=2919499 RepID=UPI0021D901B5